jgi:hypothetical protein
VPPQAVEAGNQAVREGRRVLDNRGTLDGPGCSTSTARFARRAMARPRQSKFCETGWTATAACQSLVYLLSCIGK